MPTEGLIRTGIEDDGGPPPAPRPAAPPAPPPVAAGVSEMPDWCPRYRELQNRSDLLREEGKTLTEAERAELARLRGRLDLLAAPEPPIPAPPGAAPQGGPAPDAGPVLTVAATGADGFRHVVGIVARADRLGERDARITAARAGVAGIRNAAREAGALGGTMSEVLDRLAELEAIGGRANLPANEIGLEVRVDPLASLRDAA